jgi:hypothetical protein
MLSLFNAQHLSVYAVSCTVTWIMSWGDFFFVLSLTKVCLWNSSYTLKGNSSKLCFLFTIWGLWVLNTRLTPVTWIWSLLTTSSAKVSRHLLEARGVQLVSSLNPSWHSFNNMSNTGSLDIADKIFDKTILDGNFSKICMLTYYHIHILLLQFDLGFF